VKGDGWKLERILGAPLWREVAAAVILVALLFGFLIRGWEEILANWNSVRTDQSAYLHLGLDIRQGVALTDGNRHPLYPAILALFARLEWSYFTSAKLLNLGIGTLTLLAGYWVMRRVGNVHAALLTVVLLSQAHRFLDSAAKVVVEPLLTLIVIVTWFLVWEGRGSSTSQGLAGLGAGLAYLAKGTGQIILIAFLVSAVLIHGKQVLRKRAVWLFLAGYVVLATGLWLYNARHYGNPFYSFSTTHAMWLDNWEDRYVDDSSRLPTMITYLQSHSLQQIVRRLSHGLVSVLKPIKQTWIPLWDFILPLWQSVLLARLVLRATATSENSRVHRGVSSWKQLVTWLRAHREGMVFTVILLGMWYVLFAWYFPVSDSPRFFLPVAPLSHCGIACALVLAVRMIARDLPWPQGQTRAALVNVGYVILSLIVVLAVSRQAVSGFETDVLEDPFRWDREQNADADALLRWLLSREANRPVRLLSGPGWTLPFWMYEEEFAPEDIPSGLEGWDQLAAFVSENDLSWVVVDADMLERRPDLLGKYFSLENEDLVLQELPPGWKFVREFGGSIYDWYVFRPS
jgi:4-amino-4-deoxy-L-arabinose transferase-like glycosyltransferase